MNNWPRYSADLLTLLTLIRLLALILIQEKLKPIFPTPLAALSPTSSIISCSNAVYISVLIQHNSTWTLWKSTSQWPTLWEYPRTSLRWTSIKKIRTSFKTGSLTGTYLWTSYVNILVSWTLLVKRPTCWTISTWSLVTRFPLTMWTSCAMPPN